MISDEIIKFRENLRYEVLKVLYEDFYKMGQSYHGGILHDRKKIYDMIDIFGPSKTPEEIYFSTEFNCALNYLTKHDYLKYSSVSVNLQGWDITAKGIDYFEELYKKKISG